MTKSNATLARALHDCVGFILAVEFRLRLTLSFWSNFLESGGPQMNFKKIDASLLCFALVVLAAIPVAALRTKTYAIGYELGRLKSEERLLRQRNTELQGQLASVQRAVRDAKLKNTGHANGAQLDLPAKSNVLRPENASDQLGKTGGEKNN